MKRVINLLFVQVLLMSAFPVLAQEESSLSEMALRKTYSDNWYISIGPSANILFAEQDRAKSAFSRLKFGGEFSVGKWMNQNTGFSLNIMGGGLRGFNYQNAPYESGYYTGVDGHHNYSHPMGGPIFIGSGLKNPKYTYVETKGEIDGLWQDFNYLTTTVDVMNNITNLFRGYGVENSWFDLVGFVGLGVNYAFDNGNTTPNFYFLTGRIGLRANFNFTKNLGIYLESVGYATDPEFDGYKGTALGDMYANVSLGLQYTFNKRVFSFEKVTIDELDRLNRRVNENRDLIENHQDILERQQKLLDKLGSQLSSMCTEKQIPIIHKTSVLPGYIRFDLDSYTIKNGENSKIDNIVAFLKGNPDAKILMIGYADKKTGNSTYNYSLSKKRVNAVLDAIKRSGIDGNRIFVEWKGDREQPFTTNDWNRVVVIVERK
jgi:outer membrane protein OmpA-like peptidoglycan-associated protein